MRYLFIIALSVFFANQIHAAGKDSTIHYPLADSIIVSSFITDVTTGPEGIKNKINTGISSGNISVMMEGSKKEREIEFKFPSNAQVIAKGLNVKESKGELEWKYEWKPNATYKLLIATAGDSAENFMLYSGYIFIPEESKWKLIGTCRIDGEWRGIKDLSAFCSVDKKITPHAVFSNTWIQRSNGSWKKMSEALTEVRPVINPMPALDSVAQLNAETAWLDKEVASGKTDVKDKIEGVYYKIIDPGNGKTVSVNDTVTVHYKLTRYGSTAVIDQASDKPATFPLKRLIKAWQLTVPLVKTGGRIKIVIPSGFAYSIRTRAAKIPPNSILEFEIEVLDTKPPI